MGQLPRARPGHRSRLHPAWGSDTGYSSREYCRNTSFAFGQIAATGEYKVLRVLNRCDLSGSVEDQSIKVFTINCDVNNACWRKMQSPELMVDARSAVVVDGVVYFLLNRKYNDMILGGVRINFDPDCVASFDIEREQWRRDNLQGPINGSLVMDNEEDMYEYISMWPRLTLAELKGCLVLVYYCRCQSDLWFLTDIESGLWVKEYSIQTESVTQYLPVEHNIKPLVVLSDRRLVVHLAPPGLLLIYDPRTNNFDEVEMRYIDAIGMYTGSLLSLQDGGMA